MFSPLLRSVTRLSTRCKRFCSCWCPEEPFDPNTRVTYLPNGVRVMTEENNSPIACVSLCVIAGSRYETANNNGLTHFIEHLAYKGFKSLRKTLLENRIHKMGARMLAKTDREMQIFSVLIAAEEAAEAVRYLSKIMLEITLDVNEMEKERYNLCLEAIDVDNDPKATLFHYLHSTAFQGTPLAQPIIGPMSNTANFDKLTTAAFLCEHYTTCRLVVAASGCVSHDAILGSAGETFGSLTACGEWQADSGPIRFTGSEAVYRDDSMPYCHVAIAFEAPGHNNPDFYAMLVMKNYIGSWHKSQGRVDNQPFYTARGAGETHCQSYQSFYITYKDVGLWGIYFLADPHHIDDLTFVIQKAWMSMCLMSNTNEVAKAKNFAKLDLARRHYGVLNSSRDMGTQMMYACRRHSLQMKCDQVSVVHPHMIKEMGMKYLYNKSPAVAAVGPSECLPEYNRTESGMYWLRW